MCTSVIGDGGYIEKMVEKSKVCAAGGYLEGMKEQVKRDLQEQSRDPELLQSTIQK